MSVNDDSHSTTARSSTAHSALNTHCMNAFERQQIFREMIAHQLAQGTLSRRRRKAIVQYAACLGINAVLAGRLIQQARAKSGRSDSSNNSYGSNRFDTPHTPTLRLTRLVPSTRAGVYRRRTVLALLAGLVLLNSWLLAALTG
jgi:hypothetical protein